MIGVSNAFSTSEVPPAERLAYWQEMILQTFVPLDVAPIGSARGQRDFTGAVNTRAIGDLTVAHVTASPMTATRSSRHIATSSNDDYFVAVHLRGIAQATQDGRRLALRPGDIALFDSTRPYLIEFQHARAFDHLIFCVPRAQLDARCARLDRATAVRVALDSVEGSLTSPYLRSLATLSSVIGSESAERLGATALDLLATALAAAAGLTADPESRELAQLGALKRHALARLGEPELSPVSVARAQFMSVRQLHRMFARENTTFGRFVREERLRRCARDLSDERFARLPIADIAARWGYRGPAHFTRAFTDRFGVGPREFRRSAR
jgi:AraC-like DNA-binding protein